VTFSQTNDEQEIPSTAINFHERRHRRSKLAESKIMAIHNKARRENKEHGRERYLEGSERRPWPISEDSGSGSHECRSSNCLRILFCFGEDFWNRLLHRTSLIKADTCLSIFSKFRICPLYFFYFLKDPL